jgi:hypothetical protein
MKAPPRWLDEPEDLPEDLLAGMHAYADLGPSEAQLAQLRVGVRLRTVRATTGVLKGIAILALLSGLAGWAWTRGEVPRTEPARTPATGASAVPSPIEVPSPFEEPAAVGPLPSVQAPAPAPPRKLKRTAPIVEASDPAAELALLRRARRALAVAPETSLALAAEHARDFPRGTFAEERELIAIEALAQTDRAAAAARAQSFATRYPNSLHAARIQVVLEQR